MGGPVHRYDANSTSEVRFPAEYDGDFFPGEFGRRRTKRIEAGGDGTVQAVHAFPWSGTQVTDMAFGPDGALYVLDCGTGYSNGDANSALYRTEHMTGGRAPAAQARANTTSGNSPLTVTFSSAALSGVDGFSFATSPDGTRTGEVRGVDGKCLDASGGTWNDGAAGPPVDLPHRPQPEADPALIPATCSVRRPLGAFGRG